MFVRFAAAQRTPVSMAVSMIVAVAFAALAVSAAVPVLPIA